MDYTKRLQQLAGILNESVQEGNVSEMAKPASVAPFAIWEITLPDNAGALITLASGKAADSEKLVLDQYKSRLMQRVKNTLVLTKDSDATVGGNTKSETYMVAIIASIREGLRTISAKRLAYSANCEEVYQIGQQLLQKGIYLNKKINSCQTVGQPEDDVEI